MLFNNLILVIGEKHHIMMMIGLIDRWKVKKGKIKIMVINRRFLKIGIK
jgi:hypothetical protein